MAESRYCKDCRPYAEVDDLKHQGALKEKSDELERLKVEANRAQETLEQQIEQFKGIVQDYADPDHRQKCTGSNCAVSNLHKQIEEKGFREGKGSIAKDDVEKWLKENQYLPAIREIVVTKGKK